mmetsp:Transcript_43120/g.41454  ORF Transcript_43120/g.41454 Transcript_43120/m.41454 type:complete len:94 (+) Transcript_43120:890-1171(+)
MKNYQKYLGIARQAGIKSQFEGALGTASFMFSMLGYYSYAFYLGAIFVSIPKENPQMDGYYNGGDVVAVFFGVVFGIFALANAAPNLKAIGEG